MKKNIKDLLRDDRGVTSIEYALIASLIAIIIVVAVIAVGDGVKSDFNRVGNCVGAPSTKTCPT